METSKIMKKLKSEIINISVTLADRQEKLYVDLKTPVFDALKNVHDVAETLCD